ncbi:uncharacterized protein LOC126830970 isoform X1 [Patella vulgata]|uniref:uncharacterized protein LOC126830970 isoform X1 n=1 Tax=Patella vulgata TaxID=6465 RepID=UPI00217F7296|nr:uncharacterized protein LOC126830970 isoform X1 [Patella vulgata]
MDDIVFCLLVILLTGSDGATCDRDAKVCEFWLTVDFKLTMMNGQISVHPYRGQLYNFNDTRNVNPITDTRDIITADGWVDSKLVIVANGTLPGPSIEVYEGQTVIVHVKNNLPSEATSIHWHGLHQRDTPWMDGVAFVTQCPIEPGQSFTYQFTAAPKGTFLYHSHIGVQRTMGLYGPFIVRERTTESMPEFVAVISDWNHDGDSNEQYFKMLYGLYINGKRVQQTKSLDGANFTMFNFHSGLINGKGRFRYENGSYNEAPLHVFQITRRTVYKFRFINSGKEYPFKVSIQGHSLTVIAADGYDLKQATADSVIINPGERFDCTIVANQKNNLNYWIRAQTLEVGKVHVAEAILRYPNAPKQQPLGPSVERQCTVIEPCDVINCPFSYYPSVANTECFTFDQLTSSIYDNDPAPTAPSDELQERFLNFAFPGNVVRPGSVNGRSFVHPPVAALSEPQELANYKCGDDCGEQKICNCMYSLDLEHDKVYQLVFTNMGQGKGWSHPVHMHGHSFYVLKMGYGSYDNITGVMTGENMDVDCGGGVPRNVSFCNNPTWANASWLGGNVPGLELKNPPRKDTIIVPTGGYVVVRIKADNPGVWFMHCHIELHNMNGMAMMINESFPRHPDPPKGFPRCGNFDYQGLASTAAKDVGNIGIVVGILICAWSVYLC